MSTVGEKIRKARLGKTMSLRQLGDALGVSYIFVIQLEKGRRLVPLRRRQALADALDLQPHDLIEPEDETLQLVEEYLRAAGGCDRAVALVAELRAGTPS